MGLKGEDSITYLLCPLYNIPPKYIEARWV
jgi:hypothetical protein